MRNERALRILDQLEKANSNARIDAIVQKMRRRLNATPMEKILAKVPGTWAEKARRIGVSRQTLYLWTRGETRPSNIQARRLVRLTGFPYAEIRGLDV